MLTAVTAPPKPLQARPRVLVTGASHRIGRAIVLDLAAHGWDVVLHCLASRDAAEQVAAQAREAGVQAEVVQADLADATACEALVPTLVDGGRTLDAVVNNASRFEFDDVATFSPARLAGHIDANVVPAIVLARALHAHRLQRDAAGQSAQASACVVNLLDQKLANPNPDHLSYTLSKAALAQATPMLAQALAPRLRVCGVAPGVTLPSGPMTQAEFERAAALNPLQRAPSAEDIARTVRFLLESPAITGSTILVDAGQHLVPQPRDVLFLVRQADAPGGARKGGANPVDPTADR